MLTLFVTNGKIIGTARARSEYRGMDDRVPVKVGNNKEQLENNATDRSPFFLKRAALKKRARLNITNSVTDTHNVKLVKLTVKNIFMYLKKTCGRKINVSVARFAPKAFCECIKSNASE